MAAAEPFEELKNLHRSLVTIYTLLSSRKHVVTTVECMKPVIERDLGRSLELIDLARVKALLGGDVFFGYVDENQVNNSQGPLPLYHRDGTNAADELLASKVFLIFEFLDQKLKLQSKKAKLDPGAELGAIIKRRIAKFETAIRGFRGNVSNEEAWSVLDKKAIELLPVDKSGISQNPMDYLGESDPATTTTGEKPTIESIVEKLQKKETHQIVGSYVRPARDSREVDYSNILVPELCGMLHSSGIDSLYYHQAKALESVISNNRNVIVTTATSSGKSLIYQLPVLDTLLRSEGEASPTAMFLFPTKALAQDQKRSLQEYLLKLGLDVNADTYDGDTPASLRRSIPEICSVIFTNPDMLHRGILPLWGKFRNFLKRLRFVVIDELHIYNGIFGTHVAYIIRRLRRICEYLGNKNLRFISCSATIDDAQQTMANLTGINPDMIDEVSEDGSPSGNQYVMVWDSPYISPTDPTSGRVHPLVEASKVMLDLVSRGVRTIAFCKIRRTCELLANSLRDRIENDTAAQYPADLWKKIMSYRSGYSPEDRRRIESEMFEGRLQGIVATNALELGIDIGSLDAVLVVGFPLSLANLKQQFGRCGRRCESSLAILFCGGDPVDQYYTQNPEEIMTAQSNAKVGLSLDDPSILGLHVRCAAYELSVTESDTEYLGNGLLHTLQTDHEGLVESDPGHFTCVKSEETYSMRPCDLVSIRGSEEDTFAVLSTETKTVIETVEISRVSFTLYEGGIFLHQGRKFLIKEVNPTEMYAVVTPVKVDWITKQRDYVDVDPLKQEKARHISDENDILSVKSGTIKVTMAVFGFFKIGRKQQILDAVDVESPPFSLRSYGYWIDIDKRILDALLSKKLSLAGAVHGAEHAIINITPEVVNRLGVDLRTECKAPEKEFGKHTSSRRRPARLIFYDRSSLVPDTSNSTSRTTITPVMRKTGLTTESYNKCENLIRTAHKQISECKCEYGCPNCVASEMCLENSEVISKTGAEILLRLLLQKEIDLDEYPTGPEPNLVGKIFGNNTVVSAFNDDIVKVEQ